MKILIIGNNGFVGSLLTENISTQHDVTGVDICWFGPNLGKSIVQDMADLTDEFISEFDTIVCLAGHSSVPMSINDPAGAIRNNVVNIERLFTMLKSEQRLIYASSTSIYGAGRIDATEDQVSYQMSNPYDISKQICDDIAKSHIAQGKQIIGLRFGTVCGVSPNTRTDLAINNMLYTAHHTGRFWVADPHLHRSWLATDDVVDAIITIINHEVFASGIYNLKSFDSTISEVAQAIHRVAGFDYDIRNSMQSTYDFTVNADLFCTTFNWKPKYTLTSLIKRIYASIAEIPECRRDTLEEGQSYGV